MHKLQLEQMDCVIEEINIQEDHVHLLVMISPKLSISAYVGRVKGKWAIKIFCKFPQLRVKQYWRNHFWAREYCVDTVGLDLEKIKI